MKSHGLKPQARSMKIMPFLHKLILSTRKMAEKVKQSVHWWKEAVLLYLIIV